MGRGQKKTKLAEMYEMCLNPNYFVVQANDLIGGKQSLSLNAAKLIRVTIMQVMPGEDELKAFKLSIAELSSLLGISPNNLYRDIDDITNNIMKNPVFIKNENKGWTKIPWVSFVEYDPDAGITIRLNELLRPFVLQLKERYTQYTLDNVLAMKSVYAIRIFELIQKQVMVRTLPFEGMYFDYPLKDIKEILMLDGKSYDKISNFKRKVLDIAIREINGVTLYAVDYECIKTGKSITDIRFHVNTKAHVQLADKPGFVADVQAKAKLLRESVQKP